MTTGPANMKRLRLGEETPIGQGGMADIYLSRQISLDRQVVIKRIKQDLSVNQTTLMRFEREAKASARLIHQNIAHVYDYVKDDGTPYIVMEYIDGLDVADILERRGDVPTHIALAIMMGVTRALAYVHSYGLIHRDIKPENIRISSKGEIKLMDFGIALDSGDSKLTMPGIIIGSPHYLSPEQVLGERLDGRSDLFSLGITLYELVTGRRPFDNTDDASVFQAIRNAEFISPRKYRPGLPFAVSQMIKKLLQALPEKRFKNAWLLHTAVRDILGFDDERPLLRAYLIHEAFIEHDPSEPEIKPVKVKPYWFRKYGISIFVTATFFAGFLLQQVHGWVKKSAPAPMTVNTPSLSVPVQVAPPPPAPTPKPTPALKNKNNLQNQGTKRSRIK